MRIGGPPPAVAPAARELKQAAQGFEALLIRQLLADWRTTGANDDWASLAEAKVAEALASQAPLGIAALLAKAKP